MPLYSPAHFIVSVTCLIFGNLFFFYFLTVTPRLVSITLADFLLRFLLPACAVFLVPGQRRNHTHTNRPHRIFWPLFPPLANTAHHHYLLTVLLTWTREDTKEEFEDSRALLPVLLL